MSRHEPSAEEIHDERYVSSDEQRQIEVAHNERVMTPTLFTALAHAHNLEKPQCGLAAIETLKLIAEMPVAPVKITTANRHVSSSPIPHIGILIRHGLARLQDGAYRATPAGREWLAKITAILPQH